jgi:hypothetical protein
MVRSSMRKIEDLVSAIAACLREYALSGDRYGTLTQQTGDNVGSLCGAATGGGFDVTGLVVIVTGQTGGICAAV